MLFRHSSGTSPMSKILLNMDVISLVSLGLLYFISFQISTTSGDFRFFSVLIAVATSFSDINISVSYSDCICGRVLSFSLFFGLSSVWSHCSGNIIYYPTLQSRHLILFWR